MVFQTYRCDGWVAEVQHALEVWPVGVDGRVHQESCDIDAVVGGAGLDHVALHVHLYQGGRRHLRVQRAERVDQEVLRVLQGKGIGRMRKCPIMLIKGK